MNMLTPRYQIEILCDINKRQPPVYCWQHLTTMDVAKCCRQSTATTVCYDTIGYDNEIFTVRSKAHMGDERDEPTSCNSRARSMEMDFWSQTGLYFYWDGTHTSSGNGGSGKRKRRVSGGMRLTQWRRKLVPVTWLRISKRTIRRDDVDGRVRVASDEQRVLRGGWTVMTWCRYGGLVVVRTL